MKKVLSVFLAMLMLFGALSVSSFATDGSTADPVTPPSYNAWFGPEGSGAPASYKQTVIAFNTNGGTLKNGQLFYVYDNATGKMVLTDGKDISGMYYMVPESSDVMIAGQSLVQLPAVEAPTGYTFLGWRCDACPEDSLVGQTFGAASFQIPRSAAGHVIQFSAWYGTATVEQDTMKKVMDILFKVFGTIIGLLAYGGDTAAGIALMEKIFGGLF